LAVVDPKTLSSCVETCPWAASCPRKMPAIATAISSSGPIEKIV
jgi:hypothetical protein